ncbi:MAG: hypothetical protein FWC87_10220, partial [Acidimicrobiaceae bacterium]|nr:hypothetical protein [Acidimicrobiaceae bacterium]
YLENELMGKLIGMGANAVSDHANGFMNSLLNDAFPVAMEVQSLKISYNKLGEAAEKIRGHASEAEESGDRAYRENSSRDLEDSSEGGDDFGDGGRFAAVIQALKQGLLDVALLVFKNLVGDLVGQMTKMASILKEGEDALRTTERGLRPPHLVSDDGAPKIGDPSAVGGGNDETPPAGGVGKAGSDPPPWLDDVQAKADAVNDLLHPFAQKRRTTVVIRATDGDGNPVDVYATSAKRGFTRKQLALIKANGGVVATDIPPDLGPLTPEQESWYASGHAEPNALLHIKANEWEPVGGAVSRPVCPRCTNSLLDGGATLTGAERDSIYRARRLADNSIYQRKIAGQTKFYWKRS